MRPLTYTFTLLFTLLTLLAACAWYRSYSLPDLTLCHNRYNQLLTLTSHQGILLIRSETPISFEGPQLYFIPGGWTGNLWPFFTTTPHPLPFAEPNPWPSTTLGFLYTPNHPAPGLPFRTGNQELRLPWYFLTLLPLLPFTLCLRTLHRHSRQHLRQKHGYCKSCGYDLRASPTTCPECGADISPQHRPHLTPKNPPNPS